MHLSPLLTRNRSIAIGSIASILARGIQTITILIITAIATRTFSKEEFSVNADVDKESF